MNVSKFIATLIVKNHNNGVLTSKEDAILRDRMYASISKAIEIAKEGRIRVEKTDEKFIVTDLLGELKQLVIYKKHIHCDTLGDFFFGLQRTTNVNGYLSYFRYVNEDHFLEIVLLDGSASVKVVSSVKNKARNTIYAEF